jgi:stage IV sporulation protein FB
MKIRITPGAILMLAVLFADRNSLLPATLLASLFHELGHIVAARLLGIRLRLLELDLFGARLFPAGSFPSYRAEGLLALAGPLASIVLWGIFLTVSGDFSECLRFATLSLALFNLTPLAGFDGGRMLFAFLASLFGTEAAARVVEISSYLSLLFLFSLSSCMLLRYGQQLTLAVLSASLFAEVFLQKR